jgi:hypothetical protein
MLLQKLKNYVFVTDLINALLGNSSARFLATDFNTGTIAVTLQISLHYSTHKVFKSHVKSSQADF